MRLKLSFVVLLFSICYYMPSGAWAQNGYSISGIVKDNYNEPLISAALRLNDQSGTMVAGVVTDVEGNFIFSDVRPGSYMLKIQYSGYKEEDKAITIDNQNIVLGIIKMSIAQTQLAEVKIKANALAVEQNGDTTAFNAAAYKVNPDATAEDLVRKMPGMDLSSGSPKAQGETVTKVLVDNKPFFGSDASTALQNLPADIIDKVQVYDEKSDQAQFTGFDDGNTTKTINIVTKPDKRQGAFGKLFAGYGDQDKYSAGGNVNYFNGNRRVSLIGMSNNVNIQNFSPQDLIGVSSGSGSRGGGHGGRRADAASNFLTDPQSGIARTNAIGLNYSDKWGKKIDVTGSYFFNDSRNVSDQEINRLYVLPEQSGQTYHEQDNTISHNYNHRFNLRMNYTIDSNNSVLFVPNLSFQKNNSQSDMLGQTFDNNGLDMLNSTANSYDNDQNAYNLSSFLLYRHKFQKKGRTLSLFANGSISRNKGNSILMANNTFADTSLNNVLRQSADNLVNNKSINANLNYTEPISKQSYLQFRYGIGYQTGASSKYTHNYSPLTGAYTDLDTALTNVFNTDYLTNSLGLAYRLSMGKLNAAFGVNAQNAQLQSDGQLPATNHIDRTYNNLLPYAFLRYRFNKTNDLNLFYRTNTDAPSVSQLQDVVNNENPLQLSAGNPLLQQDYQHNLRLRFRSADVAKSISVFGMLSGNYIQHYIGNNTFVAPVDTVLPNGFSLAQGGRYTKPENLPSYWNFNAFSGIGMPVNMLRSNLNINVQAGYERTPGVVNGSMNYANNTNFGLGLTLSSNISQKIDFTLSSNGTANFVKNTVNTTSDNNFYNQMTRLSVNYIFWKGIVLNSDITNQFYTGLSEGYNQSYYLWNVSIAKKLFKNQQGELKFSVYDLLGQNQSIQRTVSEIYSEDVRSNVLQRYFMLTFTYTLKAFKGGNAPVDIEAPDRMMPPPSGGNPGGNRPHNGGGWH